MSNYHPNLALPEPLIASQDGSFTELTITKRMPDIANRLIRENKFPNPVNQNLEQLGANLVSGYIQPLEDDTGRDVTAWQNYFQPYQNQRWIDVPWFFAETYFYRYILNITNYFYPGKWQYADPFSLQKQQGLTASFNSIIQLAQQANRWLEAFRQQPDVCENVLKNLLYFGLWGNRVDLSLWSAFESDRSQFDIQSLESHILVNNAESVVNLLLKKSSNSQRVDFVIDNAGFELVCDLSLVDFLLASGLVEQIKLHLKPHPTFVSDAMKKDVQQTIDFFLAANNWDVTFFANRLQEYLELGRLILVDDYFWTSPLAFWELPQLLRDDLANSSLIIIKGDANYRRLLDDRKWSYTTKIEEIISYLPAPMVALRTLKSEIAAGIDPIIVKKTQQADSNWLTNGQWGLIQFVG